jgi:hypothetical protein
MIYCLHTLALRLSTVIKARGGHQDADKRQVVSTVMLCEFRLEV